MRTAKVQPADERISKPKDNTDDFKNYNAGMAVDPAASWAITNLVLIGEIYVGIAMLLGFTTRMAAMVSIFMLLNYWFAKSSVTGIPGLDTADLVLSMIVLVTAAGRVFGLDQYLSRRFPRVPLW